jgi:hypothetical protein
MQEGKLDFILDFCGSENLILVFDTASLKSSPERSSSDQLTEKVN